MQALKATYLPPRVTQSLFNPAGEGELEPFLADQEAKLYLLLGQPGAGKAVFLRMQEQRLWAASPWLPVYIKCSSVSNP